MERFDSRAGEKDPDATTPVLDLGEAFEHVCVPVVWAWATHFDLHRKVLRELCGYFHGRAERGVGRYAVKRTKVEEKGLKLSITDGGKEGKHIVIASCSFLEERFQECLGLATSMEAWEWTRGRERSSWEQRRRREGRSAM